MGNWHGDARSRDESSCPQDGRQVILDIQAR